MPFHFCVDELMALMVIVPFIGAYVFKMKSCFACKKKE